MQSSLQIVSCISCHSMQNKTPNHLYSTQLGLTKLYSFPTHDSKTISHIFSLLRFAIEFSPTVRIITRWHVGTDSLLQDQFRHTNGNMFHIQTYSSLLDYIFIPLDSVITQKKLFAGWRSNDSSSFLSLQSS